jgi:hypothetical protein
MSSCFLRNLLASLTSKRRSPVRRLRSAVAFPTDALERRIVPALNVSFSAGALVITETGGVANDIEIYLDSGTGSFGFLGRLKRTNKGDCDGYAAHSTGAGGGDQPRAFAAIYRGVTHEIPRALCHKWG